MPQQKNAERRKEWNFVISDEGWSWCVRNPDGSEQRSPNVYPTLKAAADDAMTHGYAGWKKDERRGVEE